MHGEGDGVAEDVYIAASAVGMETSQAIAAQEADVGGAVGLESMAMARPREDRTEACRCFRTVVLAEAAKQVLEVLRLESEDGARELDSDADLAGGVRCAACEVVGLGGKADAGTVGRCKVDASAGIAGIVEVVVRVAARRSVGERLKLRESAVLSRVVVRVAVQVRAASWAARELAVRSEIPVPEEVP
jgi:hypothetical protein